MSKKENGFKKIEEIEIEWMGYKATRYEHKESGMKHYHYESKDKYNKEYGFNLSITTLVENNKGLPHILEHMVMSQRSRGEERKSFNYIKENMRYNNLNAYTLGQTTEYLFSTFSEEDYKKMLTSYISMIYDNEMSKEVFLREGWRYEKTVEGEISINGVVFNEMKGSYGNEDRTHVKNIIKKGYTNKYYKGNAAGNPIDIIDLSYEEVVRYYEDTYTPRNSILVTYGELNIEEIQDKVEEEIIKKEKKEEIIKEEELYNKIEEEKEIKYYEYEKVEENDNKIILTWILKEKYNIKDIIIINLIEGYIKDVESIVGESMMISNYIYDTSYNLDLYQANMSYILEYVTDKEVKEEKNIEKIKREIISIIKEMKHNKKEDGIMEKIINSIESMYKVEDFMEVVRTWNVHPKYDLELKEIENVFKDIRQLLKEKKLVEYIKERIIREDNVYTIVGKGVKGVTNKKIKSLEQKIENKITGMSVSKKREIDKEIKNYNEWIKRSYEEKEEIKLEDIKKKIDHKDVEVYYEGLGGEYRKGSSVHYKEEEGYVRIGIMMSKDMIRTIEEDVVYDIYSDIFYRGYDLKGMSKEKQLEYEVKNNYSINMNYLMLKDIKEEFYDVIDKTIASKIKNKEEEIRIIDYYFTKIDRWKLEEDFVLIDSINMILEENDVEYLLNNINETLYNNISKEYISIRNDVRYYQLRREYLVSVLESEEEMNRIKKKVNELHERMKIKDNISIYIGSKEGLEYFESKYKEMYRNIKRGDNIRERFKGLFKEGSETYEKNKEELGEFKEFNMLLLTNDEVASNKRVYKLEEMTEKRYIGLKIGIDIMLNNQLYNEIRTKGGAYHCYASVTYKDVTISSKEDPNVEETYRAIDRSIDSMIRGEFSMESIYSNILNYYYIGKSDYNIDMRIDQKINNMIIDESEIYKEIVKNIKGLTKEDIQESFKYLKESKKKELTIAPIGDIKKIDKSRWDYINQISKMEEKEEREEELEIKSVKKVK